MSPVASALRAGWSRGLIELRQTFTNPQDVFGQLFWPTLTLVVIWFMRDNAFGSSGLFLGTLALPSAAGMYVALNGLTYMSQLLTIEREDGTLLRAKATPNGMLGYLVGKIVTVAGVLLTSVVLLLVPGALIVDGLALGSAGSWLTLSWVIVLGMLATLPVGAALGALATSPRSLSLVTFPILGLVAISGIFYPITSMPGWLQAVAQVSPIYWLGLGMRSAMLPDAAVVAELGASWRHLETAGMLGLWAVLGLVLAPVLLRRMARRESGSSVAERRERQMQRVG
jgi:ABC-2 type transport system permease protein